MNMTVESVEFNNLPEGCIANIVSSTTPRDACKLSLVSTTFRSAAESDAVWDKFLPFDAHTIISQSSTAISSSFPSKKQLYLFLSQNPLLISEGKMSFQMDKAHGKKCYMISARSLFIVWGDTPRYWRWISLPDSRFSEVAELVNVCWLEIRGWINTRLLSPDTLYGAYLVLKPSPGGAHGFEYQSVDVFVAIPGGESHQRSVFLDEERRRRLRYQIVPCRSGLLLGCSRFVPIVQHNDDEHYDLDHQYPKQIGNGWLEVELGEFFNKGEDKEVEMGVYEIKGGDWKGGLIIQGIEIRPKVPYP